MNDNDPDVRHDLPAAEGPTLAALLAAGSAVELDDEQALFVLSLAQDGRPLPAELLTRARECAALKPAVAQAAADFACLGGLLQEQRDAATAPLGFTEAVLSRARRVEVLPSAVLARRLALAATLLLALTLIWEGARPAPATADPSQQDQTYRGDLFRVDPYGPADINVGLRALLPGRLDGSRGDGGEASVTDEENMDDETDPIEAAEAQDPTSVSEQDGPDDADDQR